MLTEWLIPATLAAGTVVALILLKKFMNGGVCKSTRRLDGKTVIITGANTGIGKETAKDLVKRGARVILACRDLTKANEAAREIWEETGSVQNVRVCELDLSNFESIRSFAREIQQSEKRLDILINNAGVMACPYQKTKNGFELQFGVNHLGHFLLTNLLLDQLKQSAPSRIVNLSSWAHIMGKINFEDINSEKTYNRQTAYSQSKLANILFTKELARRLKGTGVCVYALHPGAVRTSLGRHFPFVDNFVFKGLLLPFFWFVTKSPMMGAQTSIYCAVSEEVEGVTGMYYSDCAISTPASAAENIEDAKHLWDLSEEFVGLKST